MGAFKVRNAVIRKKKRVPPKNGHFEIAKCLALFCIYLFRAVSRIFFSKKAVIVWDISGQSVSCIYSFSQRGLFRILSVP